MFALLGGMVAIVIALMWVDTWLQKQTGEAPCLGDCAITNSTQHHIWVDQAARYAWVGQVILITAIVIVGVLFIREAFRSYEALP